MKCRTLYRIDTLPVKQSCSETSDFQKCLYVQNVLCNDVKHSILLKCWSVVLTKALLCLCRHYIYLLTYLLTPWCRVLLEKLTGLQLVKNFPAFHGTRRFITALTSVRHLSLSWASPIQSIYPNPTSWRSVLILSTHLRLGLPIGLLHYIYNA